MLLCEKSTTGAVLRQSHLASSEYKYAAALHECDGALCARDAADAFDQEVVTYWNKRAGSYSNYVCEELGGPTHVAWRDYLAARIQDLQGTCAVFAETASNAHATASAHDTVSTPRATASATPAPTSATRPLHVLDLGCGPGFFSIVFAQLGCKVYAVDSSAGMLEEAQRNIARAGVAESVTLHTGDVSALPLFADGAFDVIAMRNVTWLMRNLHAAYAEWKRLLAPQGKLLVFDANWYRYLADNALNEQRMRDQHDETLLVGSEKTRATTEQERRCEEIARALPTTYMMRPQWDCVVLEDLGFSSVSVDERAWEVLWQEGDKAFYKTSPLFMIEAVK